jgi:hypothetical protein
MVEVAAVASSAGVVDEEIAGSSYTEMIRRPLEGSSNRKPAMEIASTAGTSCIFILSTIPESRRV